MFKSLLCCLFILLVSKNASSVVSVTRSREISCPSFLPAVDVTNATQTAEAFQSTVKSAWSSIESLLSPSAIVLRDVMLFLLTSDSPTWSSYTLPATQTIYFLVTNPTYTPVQCFYAQMVNASDTWYVTGDISQTAAALNSFVSIGSNMQSNSFKATADRLGCKCKMPKLKAVSSATCTGDSSVYKIKELWSREGRYYPCMLQQAVMELYRSPNLYDRLIALGATAAIEQSINDFGTVVDKSILYPLTSLLTTKSVPKKCCKKFLQVGITFLSQSAKEIERSINILVGKLAARRTKSLSMKP